MYTVVKDSTGITGLSTTAKKITIDMATSNTNFIGHVSIIVVRGSNDTGVSDLTMTISEDDGGDLQFITSTESNTFAGKTTSSKVNACWMVNGIVALPTNNLYLWLQTDAATCDIDEVIITFDLDD